MTRGTTGVGRGVREAWADDEAAGMVRAAWGNGGAGGSVEEFLGEFVERQAALAGARCGAILRMDGDDGGRADVLAVWPGLPAVMAGGGGGSAPSWLEAAGRAAAARAREGTIVEALAGGGVLVVVGFGEPAAAGKERLVGAFVVEAEGEELARRAGKLGLSAGLLGVYELRTKLARSGNNLARLRAAMEVVAGTNRHAKFKACAFELVNLVAGMWRCERVSLGIVRGAYVRLAAMSHTEKIVENTRVAQAIAEAMEECVDQEIEVWAPAEAGGTGLAEDSSNAGGTGEWNNAVIRRQAEELARLDGRAWVCTIPLWVGGRVVGALTVERREALAMEEIEPLRLACELVAARLVELEERDRWIGARVALGLRRAGAWAVGAEQTWAKLLAIAALGLAAFMVFAKGTLVVTGGFVIEASERRVGAAPFDGYLASVEVESGDRVRAGDVLARIETTELELELVEARAREASAQRSASIALSQGKAAEAQIAEAEEREARARADLLRHRIARATITAPIDGVVVARGRGAADQGIGAGGGSGGGGGLTGWVGSAARMGEELFDVVSVDRLRARIAAPDGEAGVVTPEMRGVLAAVSRPEVKIPFVIERMAPTAEMIEGRRVVLLRAALDPGAEVGWLRPGMEGVAEIRVGEARYGWIWTRRLVNWARMRLWL